jgi:hypothetical protein
MAHHIHRNARLGASVLINESWYEPAAIADDIAQQVEPADAVGPRAPGDPATLGRGGEGAAFIETLDGAADQIRADQLCAV